MRCPQCKSRMSCVDSRESETKTFGKMRRRRYVCPNKCGRFTSGEILMHIPDSRGHRYTLETFLRNLVGDDFKRRIRQLSHQLYREAGGQ